VGDNGRRGAGPKPGQKRRGFLECSRWKQETEGTELLSVNAKGKNVTKKTLKFLYFVRVSGGGKIKRRAIARSKRKERQGEGRRGTQRTGAIDSFGDKCKKTPRKGKGEEVAFGSSDAGK